MYVYIYIYIHIFFLSIHVSCTVYAYMPLRSNTGTFLVASCFGEAHVSFFDPRNLRRYIGGRELQDYPLCRSFRSWRGRAMIFFSAPNGFSQSAGLYPAWIRTPKVATPARPPENWRNNLIVEPYIQCIHIYIYIDNIIC